MTITTGSTLVTGKGDNITIIICRELSQETESTNINVGGTVKSQDSNVAGSPTGAVVGAMGEVHICAQEVCAVDIDPRVEDDFNLRIVRCVNRVAVRHGAWLAVAINGNIVAGNQRVTIGRGLYVKRTSAWY